jgi:hypothetical protein
VSIELDKQPGHRAPGGWRVLAPFQFREYRLLIAALSVSIFAEGMWAVVMALQVIALDHDPAALSLVASCMAVGLVAFVLVGGIAADRFSQRSIIILVQAVNVAVVSAVAALGLLGLLQVWHMAVAAALLGVAAAFFFPAYSAYLPRILPAEQLLAANGVEGVVRPVLQRAIGPAVAGILVGATFPTVGTVAVAVLCAIGLALLVATRPVRSGFVEQEVREKPRVLTDLRDGIRFVVRTPWLLWTLLFASMFVLVVIGPIEVLLPFITAERFEDGARIVRLRHRRVRNRRRARGTGGVLTPAAPALSDRHAGDVGPGFGTTGAGRLDLFVRRDGGGHLRRRGDRRRRHGHLGNPAAAPGTAGDAGPSVESGLLRVTGLHAGVDGDRRSAVESRFDADDFPGGRPGSSCVRRGCVLRGPDGTR